MQLLLLFLLTSLIVPAGAAFAETAAQFAAPNLQAPKDDSVNGLRFSLLYGKTQKVRGLDLGLLSISESGDFSGAGFILGLGRITGDMNGGAQFSLVNLHSGNDRGLNAAFVNLVHNAPGAVDFGFLNIADGDTMADIGGLNVSKSSNVQIGFINVTQKITGFQFGFLNIAENGFLPVFPIFNFAAQE